MPFFIEDPQELVLTILSGNYPEYVPQGRLWRFSRMEMDELLAVLGALTEQGRVETRTGADGTVQYRIVK